MLKAILAIVLSLATLPLFAEQASKIERIGGNFTVQKINKLPSGAFSVEFKAADGDPKFKSLRLESDNINAAIIEGATIRLSADVTKVGHRSAEVAQVVVFLPGPVGPTPVWMLSRKAPRLEPPAKLLDMHAPATDFAVF